MFAFFLTLLPIFVSHAAAQPVRIAVFAPGDVADSLVDLICAEASAIWGSAGITFEWHRVRSEAEAVTWPLDITIDDRRAHVEPGGALGWITFNGNRPERSIHLSRACADDLARSAPGRHDPTIAAHDTHIGRALGRALAHELGHYLLQSKAHTSHGLMRRTWSSDDSFAFGRKGFELTAEQRAMAFAYLTSIEHTAAAYRSNHVDHTGVGHS